MVMSTLILQKQGGERRMGKDKVQIWLGCTSRSFLQGSVENLYSILNKINIKYESIDDLDICCGSVLFVTGQNDAAMKNLKEVEKILTKKKVDNIVSLCPGCTRTLKEYYLPRRTNPVRKVEHYTELLSAHLKELNFNNVVDCKVTYHDPCHLARHMGITKAPRDIIRAIPGVDFKELPTHNDDAFCCGSGGGLRSYNKDLANNSSLLRLQEAESLGADILLTSCPFCERSLKIAHELPGAPKNLKILNLVDFLPKYLK